MKDTILREGCTLVIEFVDEETQTQGRFKIHKHTRRGLRIKMNGAPADWDESAIFELSNGETVTIALPPMIVDQKLKK